MERSPLGAARETLRALDISPLPGALVETSGLRVFSQRLSEPLRGTLWIEGPTGCGKTTAVATALRGVANVLGIQRVDCSWGPRLEEVLHTVGNFLLQLGIGALKRVLGQRSLLRNKLSVLIEILHEHPIVLWFDDVDSLRAGVGAAIDSPPGAADGLAAFVGACAQLTGDSAGCVLFTAESPPWPGVEIERSAFPSLSAAEARRLWEHLDEVASSVPVRYPQGGLPATIEGSPLALRLLHFAHAFGRGGSTACDLDPPAPECGLEELYSAALRLLSPPARELLDTLAHFARPLSRGAIRHLSTAAGSRLELDGEANDRRLVELEGAGLVCAADRAGPSGGHLTVHPLVLKAVGGGLHELAPSRKERAYVAAARYHLRYASREDNLWPLYNAWRCFCLAGRFEEACEVHKLVIEDLLRLGYFDAAREILSRTVETTTGATRAVSRGNLAIIYKNESRYEQALALYEEARNELLAIGDRANVARVLHQIGNVHYLRQDLSSALECYHQSCELSAEIGEEAIATATQVQIANVLYQLGDEDDALVRYREIAARLRRSGAERNAGLIGAVLLQIGQIHQKARRRLEAQTCYSEAEAVVRACDDRRSLIKVLRAKAMVARECRDYDEALSIYEEAARTAAELGDLLEEAVCQLLTGDLEKERVQIGKAIVHYGAARALLEARDAGNVLSASQIDGLLKLLDERYAELRQAMGPEAFERALRRHSA
jgi:tetratricopeptide (TPR) repeat protein